MSKLYRILRRLTTYEEALPIIEEYSDEHVKSHISQALADKSGNDPVVWIIRYLANKGLIRLATQETADEATSKGETVQAYNPHLYEDCRSLLRMGYWPAMLVRPYHIYLYATYSDEQLSSLPPLVFAPTTGKSYESTIEWEFSSIGIIREKAIAEANGLRLSFLAPDLIYRSGRPKTDMSMFRNSNSNRVKREEIKNRRWGEWKVIPITRYAAGMQRSLFYSDEVTPHSYCGTFYYNEPESSVFLAYKKELRSFNKITATEALLAELPKTWLTKDAHSIIINIYKLHPEIRDHISGKLPRNLRFTTESGVTYYNGEDLYAAEDDLD